MPTISPSRCLPCIAALTVCAAALAEAQPGTPARCDASAAAVAADSAALDETLRRAMAGLIDDFELDARAKAALQSILRDPGLSTAERRNVRALVTALRKNPAEAAALLAGSVAFDSMGPRELRPIPSVDEIRSQLADGMRVDHPDPPSDIQDWVGINPATCNQFRARIPVATRKVAATLARLSDLDRAVLGPATFKRFSRDWTEPSEEQYGPPQAGPFFSQCQDTRVRSGTTTWPERTIASLSSDGVRSSCTGTLVGPRHVVTAGHCVYLNTWNDFYVIPGRDGPNRPYGSTFMSDTQGLNMGFRWYWVPEAALAGTIPDWYSGLDIAILILPQALGANTGWMGMAARTDLSTAYSKNLGYPGQPGSPIGFHPVQFEGALYGDINPCNIGDYSHFDGDGWARLAGHTCDNTSGHSGSPIFTWLLDPNLNALVPAVSLIVSHHAAFANDFDCGNNPYPYSATRVVPDYIEAFLFFRSWVDQ